LYLKGEYVMNKRLLTLLLALSVTTPLCASCGNGAAEDSAASESTVPAESIETAETEITRENMPDTLPGDLDFNGTDINVYYFGQTVAARYDGPAELTGDTLTDALYNRNLTVEERLNVKFNWVKGSEDYNGFPAEVATFIQAGASDYDFIIEENQSMFQQAIMGYFYDLMNMPYIDLDQPWWYNDLMEESSLDNSRRYFLSGDICLSTLAKASATYFNKEIFHDYFGDVNVIYEQVLDGKWTHELMMEYSRNVATDLNGDGNYDNNDILGFGYQQWGVPNYLSMSTGIEYSIRDSDGFPVLNLHSEQVLEWADTLYRMMYTDNMSFDESNGNYMDTFKNAHYLFHLARLDTAFDLRDTVFEYGILPYPKLSEELEYTSAAGTANGDGVAIPVTADPNKIDATLASIEALCAEGYRRVAPAWFESAMKFRYSDEPIDAQMLDLIHETIRSPFIMMASKAIGGVGSIFTTAIYGTSSEGTFASYWKKNEKMYTTALEDTIAAYLELDS